MNGVFRELQGAGPPPRRRQGLRGRQRQRIRIREPEPLGQRVVGEGPRHSTNIKGRGPSVCRQEFFLLVERMYFGIEVFDLFKMRYRQWKNYD